MLNTVLIGLALIALLGVVFEEKIHVSKAKITLACGCLAWVLLFITAPNQVELDSLAEAFERNIGEIANLWLFLIAAMTFVAYLNKKGMIDGTIRRLLPQRIHERALLFLTGAFCFVFSSLADNITATLVSTALVLSLGLNQKNTMKFAVVVVFSVNSGGVALISGDVTTLMIFLDDKVTIGNLLLLSLPALASVLLLAGLLSWNMRGTVTIERRATAGTNEKSLDRRERGIRNVDIAIALLFLVTILSTMIANVAFEIPPVLTFLTGLSIMFLVARFFKEDIDEDPILEYIRLIEFETLFFFLGVLLIVGMLQVTGALAGIADMYQLMSPGVSSYLVGILSSVVDNVPLTAALLKAEPVMAASDWLPLTYAVGVGGSLLVIGSASGIVCMSKIPGLTVLTYGKYLPFLFLAYSVGYLGAQLVSRLTLVH